MNRRNKRALKVALEIFIIPFAIVFTWIVLSTLFGGCEDRLVQPIEEGISGTYKSVFYDEATLKRYDIKQTYDIKFEVFQRGEVLTGNLKNNEDQILPMNGTIKDVEGISNQRVRLYYNSGNLDLFTDPKGNYYPLSGQCIYNNEARAIRFEKIGNLHSQH